MTITPAKYAVNDAGVQHARELIDAHRYVLRSRWGDVRASAAAGTRFLKSHTWQEYLRVAYGPAGRTTGP